MDGRATRTAARLPYLLTRVEHAIVLRANHALAGFGITVRQLGALEVIASAPGISSVLLAREVPARPGFLHAPSIER